MKSCCLLPLRQEKKLFSHETPSAVVPIERNRPYIKLLPYAPPVVALPPLLGIAATLFLSVVKTEGRLCRTTCILLTLRSEVTTHQLVWRLPVVLQGLKTRRRRLSR